MTFLSAEDQKRYEVLEQLGEGAFALVFRARDKSCHRDVAIKVLHSSANEAICERFIREVKVCLELRHPNIVSMYDANFDSDPPYLVMEYVQAQDVGEYLLRCDITVEQAISITTQIGEALLCLHEKSLLHRDVKPENILFEENGRAVLTDFNLVYVDNATVLTKTGQILGTPNYIPPEQWFGGLPNAQGDIYALGRVFYEMLTCVHKDELIRLQELTPDNPYPSPSDINPQVSRRLSGMVLKAVAANPDDRYASIDEFLAALAALPESTITVELPQTVKIKSDNEIKARKMRKSVQWRIVLTAILFCTLLFCCLTWSQLPPQLDPPRLKLQEPSILGVALRFENCLDDSYTVAVKTADGKRRWSRKELTPIKGVIHTVVPWKDWTPQGKLEAWGSDSRSFVTTCTSFVRFKLGKGKVCYHKRAITVEWPCNRRFIGEATLEFDSGKIFKRKAKYGHKKLFVAIPIRCLKESSVKVSLKLTDRSEHTLETEAIVLGKLDVLAFFEKLRAFEKETKGIAGLQKKVVTSVLDNNELSFVEKLKFGMPNNEVVAQLKAGAEKFRRSVKNFVEAEILLLSSPFFNRNEKLRLFNAFTFFQEIDRALYVIGGKPVFRHTGHQRLGNIVRLRKGRPSKHPVYRQAEVINICHEELPLFALLDGHLSGLREELLSATINREKAEQALLRFSLSPSWLAACGGKVGLCIRSSIEEHSYLRLAVNNVLHFILWTESVKSRRRRGVFNYELQIPKWILNKGENTLCFEHVAILPRIERLAVLKSVKLLPRKHLRKRGRRSY